MESDYTRHDAVSCVVTAFNWAHEEDLIDRNPYVLSRSVRFNMQPRGAMAPKQYVAIMRAAMEPRPPGLRQPANRGPGPAKPYPGFPLYGHKYSCQWAKKINGVNHYFGPWSDPEGALKRYEALLADLRAGRKPPDNGLGRHRRPSGRVVRRMLFFLRRTGARTCEARAVEWEHVDWDAGVIRLTHHKTAAATGQVRVIGLEPCVLRFLKNLHRHRRPGQTHIFLNGRGKPWKRDHFTKIFRTFATRAGLPMTVSAYSIRHLFATQAIENGVPERGLADQLGHTTTKLIGWYARQTRQKTEHLRNVAAQAVRKRPA